MDWKGIVVHHSASHDVSANEIERWHKQRNFRTIGYHFVIRQSGALEPARVFDQAGAHKRGYNASHLGICLTGRLHKHPPTLEQVTGLVRLTWGLMERFGIEPENIIKHHEQCPGKMFPWDFFMSEIKEGY